MKWFRSNIAQSFPPKILAEYFSDTGIKNHSICNAPFAALYFTPEGLIKPCCAYSDLQNFGAYPETGIRHASSKKVFVTFKTIGSLHASSGSEVKSKMELKMNSIDISVSSGADIDLAISASKMRVDCNSGANVDLSGSAENLDVDGSSGANIKISDLKSINCNAGASSGANVRVTVTEKLSAKASSGGQIRVSGDPKERDVQKSSGGDVSFR